MTRKGNPLAEADKRAIKRVPNPIARENLTKFLQKIHRQAGFYNPDQQGNHAGTERLPKFTMRRSSAGRRGSARVMDVYDNNR